MNGKSLMLMPQLLPMKILFIRQEKNLQNDAR